MKFRGSLKFEEIPFTPWSYKTKNYCWSCIIILISIRCIILQNCIAFEHWLSTFLIQMKIKYLAIKWVMALFLDRQFMKYLCTILQNNIQKCIAFENWLLTFWPRDAKHRGPRSVKVAVVALQILLEKFVETLVIVFIVFNGYISRWLVMITRN